MNFPSSELSAEAAYKLLVGCIVPRPIAWLTTLSEHKHVNAAPFSQFTFVSNSPPMVAICISRRDGELKDTARNIMREKEFVANIADLPMIDHLHRSSFPFPEEISEVSELQLLTASSSDIRTPRLRDAPISLECTLNSIHEFGAMRSQLMIGEVRRFHVRDNLCSDGKIDSVKLNPIARIGGPVYAQLGDTIIFSPNIYPTTEHHTPEDSV